MELLYSKWFVPKNVIPYSHKYIKEYFIISLYDLIVGYLFSLITKILNLGIYTTSYFFSKSITGSSNQIVPSKIKENIYVFFLLVYQKIYFSKTHKMNSRVHFIDIYIFNLKM
jgi:hypothetical protein